MSYQQLVSLPLRCVIIGRFIWQTILPVVICIVTWHAEHKISPVPFKSNASKCESGWYLLYSLVKGKNNGDLMSAKTTFTSHFGGGGKIILNTEFETHSFELCQINVIEPALKWHTLWFCSAALFLAVHKGFMPTLVNVKLMAGHKNTNWKGNTTFIQSNRCDLRIIQTAINCKIQLLVKIEFQHHGQHSFKPAGSKHHIKAIFIFIYNFKY